MICFASQDSPPPPPAYKSAFTKVVRSGPAKGIGCLQSPLSSPLVTAPQGVSSEAVGGGTGEGR